MRILGVDIGGTMMKFGITDEQGIIEQYREYPTESKKGGPYIVQKVINLISNFTDFDAIGISTAGQVNQKDGSILYANENIPHYTGMKLKAILEEHFQVPVKVENDVNAAALGENYFGKGSKYDDFLFLTYGTGIGGAIVMASKIYHGQAGIAGEFGHMITHPNGILCNCGNKGCYEAYASTTALMKKAQNVDAKYIDGKIIFEAYRHSDEKIGSIIDDWVEEIALGLVSLIHIFNPPAVIIGGGIMEQAILIEKISTRVKYLIMDSFRHVEIQKATLGNKAGLLGAASLHLK
ncbi:ROK family protein [Virgibacillus soli]|uniref:ROK family protein n=1 Tax=Paracerasibacillus soli TaxID=480284 RepID=UPI0035ED0196